MYFYDLPNNVEMPSYNNSSYNANFLSDLTFTLPQCILTIDIMNKTKNFLSLH